MGYARALATTKTVVLQCPCGMKFPIRRKIRKLKEPNHIKDLYCVRCRTVTKHIELREW